MVSIIVPIYNVAQFLPDCLDSIISQTYSNIEIILIDDGSTDNSYNICKEYKEKDPRISIFHKKNGGLSDARNFGIKQAHGSEITFVDSDDVIANNMIEELLRIKRLNNSQMSVCFRQYISEEGHFISNKTRKKETVYLSNTTKESFKLYFKSKGGGLVTWGKLYDKTLFNTIQFPIGKYHEDVFTTYRLIAQCERIAITSKQLYYYRLRAGSIQNRHFEKKHLDLIFANIEMTEFLECKYPSVASYSKKLLIYSVLNLAKKMYKSDNNELEGFLLIKNTLRRYKRFLLFGNYSLIAKIKGLTLLLISYPQYCKIKQIFH